MEQTLTDGQVAETTIPTEVVEQVAEPVVEDAAAKYAKYYADTPAKTDDPVVTGISSLKQEISELKTALASRGAPSEVTSQVDQTFLGLLRDGKDREAEEYLVNKASQKNLALQEDLKAQFEQRIAEVEQNIQQRSAMDHQINEFVTTLKSQNPELVDFEDIITMKAQNRLQGAIASGRVQTQQDMIEAFKGAVLLEVDSAKQLIQRLRGAGKTEALTTKQTILSSSPARPNGVTAHGDQARQEDRKPMTTSDYLALRRERQATNQRWANAS